MLTFLSCNNKRELRQVYKQATYDSDIIGSLALYDSLKNILILNIDTIFKLRNRKNFVFHSYASGDTATVQENSDFYHFYYNYDQLTPYNSGTGADGNNRTDEINEETIPATIYPIVSNLMKRLGNRRITDFQLYADSSIDISVKDIKRENVEITHILIWKSVWAKNTDPDKFYRDTMIAPRWTYHIWVGEQQGW